MFSPGETANPRGRIKNDATQALRDAITKYAKCHHMSVFGRIAKLYFTDNKFAIAILPYIAPKLRSLEVSGEVTVPFQFVIERSDGDPVALPAARKQVTSRTVTLPLADAIELQGSKPAAAAAKRSAHKSSKKHALQKNRGCTPCG